VNYCCEKLLKPGQYGHEEEDNIEVESRYQAAVGKDVTVDFSMCVTVNFKV
jgi:hypothetical protein